MGCISSILADVGISTRTQLKEAINHGKALQETLKVAKQKRLDNLKLLSSEEEKLMKQVDRMIQKAREMVLNTKEDIMQGHEAFKEKLSECLTTA